MSNDFWSQTDPSYNLPVCPSLGREEKTVAQKGKSSMPICKMAITI